MSENTAFLHLIVRVRAGDQAAAAALIVHYEPAIRRAIKVQLRDNCLRRQLDSLDICQSVGDERGTGTDALRKQLTRALDLVAQELHLYGEEDV